MNSREEQNKRGGASINSLLNPEAPRLLAAPVRSIHPQRGLPDGYPPSLTPEQANQYGLRTARWEGPPEDQAGNKRRQDANGTPTRSYQYGSDYSDASARGPVRPFGLDEPAWHPHHDVANLPYGSTNAIGPMYSEERTPMAGDYNGQNGANQYNQYQDQQSQPQAPQFYQYSSAPPGEFISDLAARPHQQPYQQQSHQPQQLPLQQPTRQQPPQQPSPQQAQQPPQQTPPPPPPQPPPQQDQPQPQHSLEQQQQSQQLHSQPQFRYIGHPAPGFFPQQPPGIAMPQHFLPMMSPQMMPSPSASSASKRAAPETEEPEAAPKAKKTKGKTKPAGEASPSPSGGVTNSKRGYNAKKRSEAAQIAAQNAQLMPTVSYAQPIAQANGSGEVGPMRIVEGQPAAPPAAENSGPLNPELQFARCMSNRYKSESFPRCVSCTRRWAGDTCRFQGIRFFLKDQARNIVGISFVESQKADAPSMNFPGKWNIPLKPAHVVRVKRTVAKALLPILRKELEHLNLPEIIRRFRESEVRATCDTCMTSIFSSSWMCRLCGREACAECYEQVRELTVNRPGATPAEIMSLQAKREKHAHSNPFFLSCTRRNEHQAKDFSPMSRFCKPELTQAIKDMVALLETPDESGTASEGGNTGPAVPAIDPSLGGLNGVQNSVRSDESSAHPAVNGSVAAAMSFPVGTIAISPAGNAQTGGDIPTHPIRRFTDEELTEDIFRCLWALGEPMVVTGLLSKFQIKWGPEHFIEKYDTQPCLILECQTDKNKRITVGEFFRMFGQYEGRTECWKLKDWPSSADFKVAFPDLYEDFSRAVPVPNYVRRDGVLNVASHFPSNTVAPDLGPKMYNAMASVETAGSKGSTRLHMDMADALNVMTYAAPLPSDKSPNPEPGYATWDLYRSEDSDKIRQFLRKRFKGGSQHDPIHSQQFYLDEELRRLLLEETGVMSHRVYQRPGEAVFIPAGCAHQVCNAADSIKVAVDFVSPENIDRCENLTREFREQNQSMVWKEDVLQLRTMMWFAWLSCCRQES